VKRYQRPGPSRSCQMKWTKHTAQRPDELARLAGLPPHEVLGVPADAALPEIKRIYRRMVRIDHPDSSHPFMRSYNEEVMKLLNEAYEKLLHSHGSKWS